MEIYNPTDRHVMCTCKRCQTSYSASMKTFYQMEIKCPICDSKDFHFGAEIATEEGRANVEKYLGKKYTCGIL